MPDDQDVKPIELSKLTRAPVASNFPMFDTAKFEHMQRIASAMASANLVPKHLRGSIGDCLMVVELAYRLNVSPFMLAQKTYLVDGKIGYEAQLIAAMVNTSPLLEERLRHSYEGSGADLQCIVYGRLRGEPEVREKKSPKMSAITIKNSPLWKVDPEQQLLYWTQRAWGRAHTPELLLGLYTPDDLESMIDITPPRPTRDDFKEAADSKSTAPQETPMWPFVDHTGEVHQFPNAKDATSVFEKALRQTYADLEAAEQHVETVWSNNGELLTMLRESGKEKTADMLANVYTEQCEAIAAAKKEPAAANDHQEAKTATTAQPQAASAPATAASATIVPWTAIEHPDYKRPPSNPVTGGGNWLAYLPWLKFQIQRCPRDQVADLLSNEAHGVGVAYDYLRSNYPKEADAIDAILNEKR